MTGKAIREALEPFAKAAVRIEQASGGGIADREYQIPTVTMGDLRRARTAFDAIGSGVGDVVKAEAVEKLGKFGWHPDPVIDFEVEIEKLESRFDCAMRGTSKPGEEPEALQAVCDSIQRAMTFKAGGTVEGVVAKNRLRELERRVLSCLSTVAVEEAARGDCANCDGEGWSYSDLEGRTEECHRCSGTGKEDAAPPQIGNAEAGPVGEAVAWLCIASDGGRHLLFADGGVPTGWASATTLVPVEDPAEIVNDLEEAQANVVRLTLAVEDNLQATKEAEEARNEAMRGERAAEAALAEERKVVRAIVAAAGERPEDQDIIQHVRTLAKTRERLDKLLAAAGKARTALAGFTSISDAAYALDVALAAASSEVVR